MAQSWDIVERWRSYKSSCPLRSQPKLANSLRKYGAENHRFEIVAWFSAGCDQPTLDKYERDCMTKHRDEGVDLLNIREGGSKGKQAPESSAKMVATRRANGSYPIKKVRLPPTVDEIEATRQKRRRIWLGRKHSEESKLKIGSANRKSKRPDLAAYNREFKSSQMRGRKHTVETKRKIGEASRGKSYGKGRTQSPEERQKRSEITRLWWANKKATEAGG